MKLFVVVMLFLITLILLNYCAYPLYLSYKRKLICRFFEGRLVDNRVWHEKVFYVCKKWLINTPKVSYTDKALTLLQMLFNKDCKSSIQVWQSASLYIALNEALNYRDTTAILRTFRNSINAKYKLKDIKDSDYGMLAFALPETDNFSVFKQEMLKYIDKNTSKEIILYKSHTNNIAFVDTLGFICPFLVKYGIETDNNEYISLAKKQIELYLKYGTEENSGLPFHAFDINTHTKLGICDWARGLAWLLIALMDSYKTMASANISDAFFEKHIKEYSDIVVNLQKANGGYSWRLFSNYETDSSATAVFGWFLACSGKFLNNNYYTECAEKCREFLKIKTRTNGIVDYCQGDTLGIGSYSRSFSIMPFAQAFALRLNGELENGKEQSNI